MQIQPPVSISPVTATMVQVIAVAFLLAAKEVFVDRRGRNRRAASADLILERRFNGVEEEIRSLTAHVIGPDGQNGMRSDIRELKSDVKGLLSRESQRGGDDRLHGEYRR